MLLTRLAPPALALLLAAAPTLADEPRPLPLQHSTGSANQRTADAIAEQIKASGQLKDYSITVSFANGTAELSGSVADPMQRDEAARLAQGVPGVARVLNRLDAGETPGIALAQEQVPAPRSIQAAPAPVQNHVPVSPNNEPVPTFRAPGGAPVMGQSEKPPLPPFAWPTYAPYNNVSRVAYPTSYPPEAFPFIGPPYPFPRVPPGWRKVVLEWNDGHWWLSSHAQKRDWWALRYW